MARVVSRRSLDRDHLDQLLQPRTHPFQERLVGEGEFAAAGSGPLHSYERRVIVEPDGDRWIATETISFKLAIPYFAWFFFIPFRLAARRAPWKGPAWWMPADTFDQRAVTVLATLCAVAVVAGYLNTLFSQTVPFAADEFDAGATAEGVTGAAVRVGGVFAFVIAATADRRGRRLVVLGTTLAGCVLAATGALAPSLAWLGGSQLFARACATALVIVVPIMVAEEMPAGSRAYAVGLLAMAGALGAGFCVLSLTLADLGVRGWRLVYVVPLLGLLLLPGVARRLPETRRFTVRRTDIPLSGHGRRLFLLAMSLLVLNLYVGPSSQFFNRFLKDERHYSGAAIALIVILTSTPGAIGVISGGVLADRRGRRTIAVVSLVVGIGLTVATYFTFHWQMWLLAMVSTIVFAACGPPLAVYEAELFPTSLRGKVGGIIGVTGLAGSAIGLSLAGVLTDHFDRVGPAMAILGAGPLMLAVLVALFYPETARVELETLNPEDAPPLTPPP